MEKNFAATMYKRIFKESQKIQNFCCIIAGFGVKFKVFGLRLEVSNN